MTPLARRTAALICAFAVSTSLSLAPRAAHATGETTALTNVIALVAERLSLATPVAQYKWINHKPITDAPREKQVLADVVARASSQGVDPDFARLFFGDQIEASKIVQERLFAQWHASGAPTQAAPDLSADIRPHLDRLDATLIQALARVTPVRHADDCQSQLAESLANWRQLTKFDSSESDALMRALNHVCESGGVPAQG
ncbi:chorismate mutase [Pararobbsia silviterrae]|uniref:Chorismate mutase n=1 Tax=Pararobbsia silviterrae TaxID=1792498 RepID=A0A494Y9M1_9BURK|nr:chorismate mutase [Pararobbsia silviterrae]RKP56600.1 chorismate mutase [Pararobbsia silviterrae]